MSRARQSAAGAAPEPDPLGLNGPLPEGTVVLEASAGTGKTFALAHMALRLVAERNLPLEQLLVVTFSRAAASELSTRIRRRFEQAIIGLSGLVSGHAHPESADPVLADLLEQWRSDCSNDRLLARLQVLLLASESIDLAPITTIHGFIQRLVEQSGSSLGVDPASRIQEQDNGLLEQLVADWRLNQFRHGDGLWLRWTTALGTFGSAAMLRLARQVDGDSGLLLPGGEGPSGEAIAARWQADLQAFAQRWQVETARPDTSMLTLLIEQARGRGKQALRNRIAAIGSGLRCFQQQGVGARDLVSQLRQLRDTLRQNDHVPGRDGAALGNAMDGLLCRPGSLLRQHFCNHIRSEARRRRALDEVLSFADLLGAVDPRPLNEEQKLSLQRLGRERVSACLIDEFQDTDPIQWRLFRLLYDGHCPLVLVGDPKQAIYRFRGGDLQTYLQATQAPDRQLRQLCTNHRSDAPLVESLNRLMGQEGSFGREIAYRAVTAAAAGSRLLSGEGRPLPALVLRWCCGDWRRPGQASRLERSLQPRLVNEIGDTLAAGWRIETEAGLRPVEPGDLAVLVRTNGQAQQLLQALEAAGIGARIARGGNIWSSAAAQQWQQLLQVLASPGQEPPAVSLALTDLGGWSVVAQQDRDGRDWSRWMDSLARAGERYGRDGPLPALLLLLRRSGAMKRLLGRSQGEQRFSDLRQIGERLQDRWQELRQGPQRLGQWLETRRAEAQDRWGGEARRPLESEQQRLVRDGSLVTIATVHASKGLEYGIVWCPFLWQAKQGISEGSPFAYHHPQAGRSLELCPAPESEQAAAHRQAAQHEQWLETLRLGYVAMTRARHQLILHLALVDGAEQSLPAWLLQRPPDTPASALLAAPRPWKQLREQLRHHDDPSACEQLRQRLNQLGVPARLDRISLEGDEPAMPLHSDGGCTTPATAFTPVAAADMPLTLRVWRRPGFDLGWQRSSYSRLIDGSDPYPRMFSGAESPSRDLGRDTDEGPSWQEDGQGSGELPEVLPPPGVQRMLAAPTAGPAATVVPAAAFTAGQFRPEAQDRAPWDGFGGGAGFGSFLHDVLETLDFAVAFRGLQALRADDTSQARLRHCLERHGRPPGDLPRLEEDLVRLMQCRLGPPCQQMTLGSLAPQDRLHELRFDLPAAGGFSAGDPARAITMAAIARVLKPDAAALPAGYLDQLAGLDSTLRGFLNGFIDVTFRLTTPSGTRWFVADWKTNRLAHGGRQGLDEAMARHHYPLQGALYALAMHRLLRQRLRDYRAERDFGGILYLFLREMRPGDSSGVWFWCPSASVLHGLDRLLREGEQPPRGEQR